MSLICSIPLIANLFSSCIATPPLAVGYVEGEHVLLAPVEVAPVQTLAVKRGDKVFPGMVLATLEDADAKIAVADAGAALAQAEAQLANLKEGRRPEEIGVLEAARNSAAAESAESQRVVTRLTGLSRRGVASTADLDNATTQLDLARAKVAQADANLAVARLPAREHEIHAAEQQVMRAKAAQEQAAWRLSKRVIKAPDIGEINDIIRNPGDTAGPAAPVLAFLPQNAVKLKLYFSEEGHVRLTPGAVLDVHCDGCPQGLQASISYVSPNPEFTPPVIYSLENRQKLVYLVEARETGTRRLLRPGQIVDVSFSDTTR
jgi:HlyD family secretion protein